VPPKSLAYQGNSRESLHGNPFWNASGSIPLAPALVPACAGRRSWTEATSQGPDCSFRLKLDPVQAARAEADTGVLGLPEFVGKRRKSAASRIASLAGGRMLPADEACTWLRYEPDKDSLLPRDLAVA